MKLYKTILGAKGILPSLILNCYVLCTPTILKTDGANMVPSIFVCPYYTVTVPVYIKKLCPATPTFRQYWDVISSLMVCRSPVFPYKAYHKRPEHLQAEDLRSHGFHLSDKSFLQTYFSRKHHEIRYHH